MLHPSETGQKKNFQGTKIILKGLGAHKKRLTEVLCAWANQKRLNRKDGIQLATPW